MHSARDIHPLDLADLLAESKIQSLDGNPRPRNLWFGEDYVEINGVLYHQTVTAPRAAVPQT